MLTRARKRLSTANSEPKRIRTSNQNGNSEANIQSNVSEISSPHSNDLANHGQSTTISINNANQSSSFELVVPRSI